MEVVAADAQTTPDEAAGREDDLLDLHDPLTLGDAGRVADLAGVSWWINARAGLHYIEAKINQATASDAVAQTAAEEIVAAVIAKIP